MQPLMLLYVNGRLNGRDTKMSLSPVQSMIMVATALQLKTIDKVSVEIKIDASNVLALFNKCLKKINTFLQHNV